jgi:hypothetical protein
MSNPINIYCATFFSLIQEKQMPTQRVTFTSVSGVAIVPQLLQVHVSDPQTSLRHNLTTVHMRVSKNYMVSLRRRERVHSNYRPVIIDCHIQRRH